MVNGTLRIGFLGGEIFLFFFFLLCVFSFGFVPCFFPALCLIVFVSFGALKMGLRKGKGLIVVGENSPGSEM